MFQRETQRAAGPHEAVGSGASTSGATPNTGECSIPEIAIASSGSGDRARAAPQLALHDDAERAYERPCSAGHANRDALVVGRDQRPFERVSVIREGGIYV